MFCLGSSGLCYIVWSRSEEKGKKNEKVVQGFTQSSRSWYPVRQHPVNLSLSLWLIIPARVFFFFFFFRWNLIVVFVESGWSLWKFWLIDISCLLYSGLAADFFESSGSIDQTVYTNLPWSCIKVSRWVIQSGYFVWISVVWWGLLACWCQNESWDFAFTRAL